uniref:Uncharacterized protein n=1 Tax=Rhizophora mucronata TaxID=61149 RepID=A0A2P2R383_RHIMU
MKIQICFKEKVYMKRNPHNLSIEKKKTQKITHRLQQIPTHNLSKIE